MNPNYPGDQVVKTAFKFKEREKIHCRVFTGVLNETSQHIIDIVVLQRSRRNLTEDTTNGHVTFSMLSVSPEVPNTLMQANRQY